ncbi:uncharacterized protein J7T54_000742 [Emericellopsis cladophorae]|uniref:DUF427 domain-containing protein n=1 Tax=Emericellopsis cladophorae TaxID=2686198 RepID=A0A9P9XVQ0_9HYPO|nr:uncharacterized protein J7T54_000742 [Emericellopsis cladophorae]KAI6778708.1 hypothetical protein J7T54_000742 [Emericellopsis cladophorae]
MAKLGAHGCDLRELALRILTHEPEKTERTPKRVRVVYNHAFIADATDALLVWEHPYYPQYYLPEGTLQNCTLSSKQDISHNGKILASVCELTVAAHDGLDQVVTDRVLRFHNNTANGALAGRLRLEFGSMDRWLEEDMPIHVHPKDPYKRVDVLPSQRPIEMKVSGKTVAKTNWAMHLYETGLPVRYYMPLSSVDQSVLRKSPRTTKCPYKGEAEYYDVIVDGSRHEGLVWYYRHPVPECASIAELVCFYNEQVDVYLGGHLQRRPQ